MEQTPTRIALIGIVVENSDSVEQLNSLLSQYGNYIIGRMGIPYREKKPLHHQHCYGCTQQRDHALSGKIGMLPGIFQQDKFMQKTNFRGTFKKRQYFSMNKNSRTKL